MKIRLEEVVASSLRRMDSRHVHGNASVYKRWAKNLATFRSLLVSNLQPRTVQERHKSAESGRRAIGVGVRRWEVAGGRAKKG